MIQASVECKHDRKRSPIPLDVIIRIGGQAGQGMQSGGYIMVNSVGTGASFAGARAVTATREVVSA